MVFRLSLLLLIFFVTHSYIHAQHFKYKHFDVDDGLPSSQVFCAFQDTEGYMWFTTDNGLSRFDGYKFENYSTKDGIIDNTILKGQVAKDSSILFFTLSSGFFWYKNGLFYSIKSKDYEKLISHQKLKIREYFLDENKTIWFATNENRVYYSLDFNGKLKKYKCSPGKGRYGTFLVKINNNNLLPVNVIRGNKKEVLNLKTTINNNAPFIPNIIVKKAIKQKKSFILLREKDELLKNGAMLYTPEKGSVENYFSSEKKIKNYTSIIFDDAKNTWVGHEKGIDFYKKNNNTPIHLLPKTYVTHLSQDFEKNIWITTKDNGAYVIQGTEITNYLKNEKIVSLSNYNNILWATSITGKVFKTDSLNLFSQVFDKKDKGIIVSSHISETGVFLYDGIYDFSGAKKYRFTKKRNNTINAKEVIKLGDSVYLVGTHAGLAYTNIKTNYFQGLLGPRVRTNALFKDSLNTVLLGTVKGLFSFNYSTLSYKDIRNNKELLSERIMDIEKWGDKYLLATKGKGLVIYNNDTLFAITKETGLASNLISCVTVANDSVVWVGSNKGVARIEFNPTTLKTKNILNYTNVEGLSSNEVIDIIYHKSNIWVATSKGVSLLSVNSSNTFTLVPKLRIKEVLVNNTPILFNQALSLKHNENNITINYLGISFKTIGKLTYRYRLKGYINQWTETQSKSANFINIPAGNHTFELQVQNKDGIWSPTQTLNFSIAKHYTQEFWFIALIVLLIISIPSTIIFIYSKNRRAQEKQKRKALEAQLLALRNQVNPHFIFNALNSIQAYNVKTRDKDAIKYLSNFSELMRQILENTKHSFINLYEEISCIKNYLELESLRTNGRFTQTITISENIEPLNTYLPPMLIQPHLENAIWKGFTKEIQNPNLHIEFSKQNYKLHIKIRDNGIGINKGKITTTKATSKHGYASTGIKNILERVESIKKLYNIDISINILDISEVSENQIGTEVHYTITLLKELPKSI